MKNIIDLNEPPMPDDDQVCPLEQQEESLYPRYLQKVVQYGNTSENASSSNKKQSLEPNFSGSGMHTEKEVKKQKKKHHEDGESSIKDPNLPKRASSSFLLFRSDAAKKGMGTSLINLTWALMTDEDKVIWKEKAAEAMKNYKNNMQEYNKKSSGPSGGTMIKVQTITGKEIEIDIEPTDTINIIKERVDEKEGIPPIQQRLIYNGKQLADDKTAKDYHIKSGSVLHLVLALRGGL